MIVDRDATVHLLLTAATTARAQQIAAEALLGLVPEATADVEFVQEEGTANDELIVGLIDSLSRMCIPFCIPVPAGPHFSESAEFRGISPILRNTRRS